MDSPASSKPAKRKNNVNLASPPPSKRKKHEPSSASASSTRTPTSAPASSKKKTPTSTLALVKSSGTPTLVKYLQGKTNKQDAVKFDGNLYPGDVPEIFRGKSDQEIAILIFENPTGACLNFTRMKPEKMKQCVMGYKKKIKEATTNCNFIDGKIETAKRAIQSNQEHQITLRNSLRTVQEKIKKANDFETAQRKQIEERGISKKVCLNQCNLMQGLDRYFLKVSSQPYQDFTLAKAQEIIGVSSWYDFDDLELTRAEYGGRFRLLKYNGYGLSKDFRGQFTDPESDFCKRNGIEPKILIDASKVHTIDRLKIRLCDYLGIVDIPQSELDKHCTSTESESPRLTLDLELEDVSDGEEDSHAQAAPVALAHNPVDRNPFDGMSHDQLAFLQQKLHAAARNSSRNSSHTD